MRKAIIFDIDGCISNVEHRKHFLTAKTEDWKQTPEWEAFNNAMVGDSLNEWAKTIIDKFKDTHTIILCTGRMETHRRETMDWLAAHCVTYNHLMMRKEGDHRHDDIIKEEIYRKKLEPCFDVEFVVEDRLRCVKMWRRIGLLCLQNDPGDF